MKQIILSWVVGTAVYLIVLYGTAAVIGGIARSTGEVSLTWLLLVVPPLVAAMSAVAVRRAAERPGPAFGLTAVAVPALVAVALGLGAHVVARRYADVPASGLWGAAVLPFVLFLVVGAGMGLWRRARWSGEGEAPA